MVFETRGFRASDAWRLRLEDIKLDEGIIELVNVDQDGGETLKGKKFHLKSNVKSRAKEKVNLTPKLLEFFKNDLAKRNPEEVWFLDNGFGSNYYSDPGSITKAFRRIMDQLGIKGVKPTHGFRATVITELCKVNPLFGQQLARHQDIKTTIEHYYDGSTDALVKALEEREGL